MTKGSNRNLQKNIYSNNARDGQETKSLGMEQGVGKWHGRNKPALMHSGVCEEKQGKPPQSSKSGSPSFSGGRHAGNSRDCTGRTSTCAAAHKVFRPRLPPQPGTRSTMLSRQPHCSLGQLCGRDTAGRGWAAARECAWGRRGRTGGCGGLREGRC